MCQKDAFYRNAQLNQDIKVLFAWNKKGAISKNWITKLETKFTESEKKVNSLENKWQKNSSNQGNQLGMWVTKSSYKKVRLPKEKMINEKLMKKAYNYGFY